MKTAVVAVARHLGLLVGGAVLEQFDVRAVAAAHHGDLLDDGPRMHIDEIFHERAFVVAERPETHDFAATNDIAEEIHALVDVGNREANVVHAAHTGNAFFFCGPGAAAADKQRRAGGCEGELVHERLSVWWDMGQRHKHYKSKFVPVATGSSSRQASAFSGCMAV